MYVIPAPLAIILATLLLAAGSFFFENKRKYFGLALLLGILISTPWFVRLAVFSEINYADGLLYVAYSFSCAFFAVIFFGISSRLRFAKPLNCILFTLLLIPCGVCFAYGISCKAVLNVDALIAIWQTNLKEACEYVREYATVTNALLLCVLLAAVYALFLRLSDSRLTLPGKSRKEKKAALALLALLLVCGGELCYKTSMNSISMVYANALKSVNEYRLFKKTAQERKEALAASGQLAKIRVSEGGGIYVLVIGESHNRDYMSAYGYTKENTPWLSQMKNKENCILFTRGCSCHTQTIPALSCALTAKNQYNGAQLSEAVSVLEAAEAAGYETAWLSNQVKYGMWDTPVSVIASSAKQQVWLNECTGNTSFTSVYDGELVSALGKIKIKNKMLIVVHLMGSHIDYDRRCPKEYAKFGTETDEAAYCNSVLYTDAVLKGIYEKVSSLPDFKAMLYFSDHASVPKQKLDHDSARFVSSMTHIPMFVCFSRKYAAAQPEKVAQLRRAADSCFTNDLIFNLQLALMGIEIPLLYEKENDLASKAYNADPDRFRTSYGERKIDKR